MDVQWYDCYGTQPNSLILERNCTLDCWAWRARPVHKCTTSSRCISAYRNLDLEPGYKNFSRTKKGGWVQREEERERERENKRTINRWI